MKVYELLDSKDKWTKGAFARGKNGVFMFLDELRDKEAASWCLLGAIMRCYDLPEKDKIVDDVKRRIGGNMIDWNDAPERKYEDVITLVRVLNI